MNIEANVLLGKREEFYFEFCRNFQIYWILVDKIDQLKYNRNNALENIGANYLWP